MRVALDRVPLREPSMEPHEVLVRVAGTHVRDRRAEQGRRFPRGVREVGGPRDGYRRGDRYRPARDQLARRRRGRRAPRTVADDAPVYDRPHYPPAELDVLLADSPDQLARPTTGDELRETLLRMAAAPNLCDRTWVTDQYDRYVRGNTVLAQPEDAGVLRIDEASNLGVAIAVDGNGRFARLDPYAGAQLALAEAYRNVAVTGARPLAVTNCLNLVRLRIRA